MYWVYILLCNNGSYYTGQTGRLPHRCLEHWEGTGARYTRSFTPLRLMYYEACSTRSEALQREHIIQSMTRTQKERLVDDFGEPPSLGRINRLVFDRASRNRANQLFEAQ